MSVVLDSSAMLALLRDEPGADVVESLFDQLEEGDFGIFAHSTNLAEVFYEMTATHGRAAAQTAIADFKAEGLIERADLDGVFWREMADLIAFRRTMPRNPANPKAVPRLALGDAFGVTLANRLSVQFVTADRTEIEPLVASSKCAALFIR